MAVLVLFVFCLLLVFLFFVLLCFSFVLFLDVILVSVQLGVVWNRSHTQPGCWRAGTVHLSRPAEVPRRPGGVHQVCRL